MTPEETERRKRVMQRSMALGHCICDPRKPCPCDLFKDQGVCECAGERVPVHSGAVRLTETVKSPGCASKIGKNDLREVLEGLPEIEDPRVVVGRSAGDDAGVVMLSDSTATILTVDVFAPSVDDAYTFGQISAANSVSDIYAMGATPQSALSIIGFPIRMLPAETMHDILRGGIDKMKEAGVSVVGGHSINDAEVKCGFAVLGTAPAGAFVTNTGAQPGDSLVLTKPLGVGIVTFGRQLGRVSDAAVDEIAKSMSALNRAAGEEMVAHGAHAATDVTGFSLLGHLAEIVKNSSVKVELDFDAIPVFSPVKELACQDVLPGAVERNREAVAPELLDLTDLTPAQQSVLFCPETSGGLLVSLPADQAEAYVSTLQSQGVTTAVVIGRVTESRDRGLIRAVTSTSTDWQPIPLKQIAASPQPKIIAAAGDNSCCAGAAADAKKELDGPCCSGGKEAAEESCCAAEAPDREADAGSCCSEKTPETPGRTGFLVPLAPEVGEGFRQYMTAVNQPGALDTKAKKLISLALSVLAKCEPCVKINTKAARDAGASDEEIREAAALGISFGGAPTNMFYNQLLKGD